MFERILNTPIDSRTTQFIFGIVPVVGLLACSGIWMLLISLELPIPIPILAAMVVLSSCYVTVWVIRIAATITGEHEKGTYDQLCLSPSGALGANWAMCAARWHQGDALGWLDLLRRFLIASLFLILLVVFLITAFRSNSADLSLFCGLFLDIILLVAVSYVEHVQSIVLGSLVAMLIPTFGSTQVDTRVWGVIVFVTLQALTLTAFVLVGLLIPPDWNIGSAFLSLLVFYLLRETVIMLIWWLLAYQLNDAPFTRN